MQKSKAKVWRAQVNAFPEDKAAKQMVDRLKNKGYNAYVTEVQNRGKRGIASASASIVRAKKRTKSSKALKSKENLSESLRRQQVSS